MKKIINILCIFLFIAVLSACSSNSTILQSLNKGEVESLQVVGGLPGTQGSPIYQSNDENGKKIISKIISWINSSKPISGQTEYGKHGYPMFTTIKMKDNRIITVEPAFDCISNTNTDGGTKSCTPVKGEIVLSINSSKIRAESPEMYTWLTEGWKQEK